MDTGFILITIAALAVTGCIAAVILYFVSQKFKVFEDPRIGQVESVLPGANCGGCGFPGCHGMAEALVKAEDLSTLLCPVGGAATMSQVASILGKEVSASAKKVAVVRCAGSCDVRPKNSEYDGAKTCAILSSHFGGETDCAFGCLGCGDCAKACQFDALRIDEKTGLPVVDFNKCVACGACVKACPRNIIELRTPETNVVSCVNKDKGAAAQKACQASCIGCSKCASVCGSEAIKIENNVAYIDYLKCTMCRACEDACPKSLIHIPTEPLKLAAKPATKAATSGAAAESDAPKAQPLVPKGPANETLIKNRLSQYVGNTGLKSANPTPVPTPISAETKQSIEVPETYRKNGLSQYYLAKNAKNA